MIQILKKINIEFDLITFDSQPNLPYTITKIEKECFEEEYQKPYIYCMCNQEEYTKITEYYDQIYKMFDGRYGDSELLFGYNPHKQQYYFSEKEWDINGKIIYLTECKLLDKNHKFIRTNCTPTHCRPLELKDSIEGYPQACILLFLYDSSMEKNYFNHVYNNLKAIFPKITKPIPLEQPILKPLVPKITKPQLHTIPLEQPILKQSDVDDGRLKNACKGKSFSQGGLNIPEFKTSLYNKLGNVKDDLDKCLNRADLHSICMKYKIV